LLVFILVLRIGILASNAFRFLRWLQIQLLCDLMHVLDEVIDTSVLEGTTHRAEEIATEE